MKFVSLPLYASWQAAPAFTDKLDPFVFLQRVSVYRRLIEATNGTGLFGEIEGHVVTAFWIPNLGGGGS